MSLISKISALKWLLAIVGLVAGLLLTQHLFSSGTELPIPKQLDAYAEHQKLVAKFTRPGLQLYAGRISSWAHDNSSKPIEDGPFVVFKDSLRYYYQVKSQITMVKGTDYIQVDTSSKILCYGKGLDQYQNNSKPSIEFLEGLMLDSNEVRLEAKALTNDVNRLIFRFQEPSIAEETWVDYHQGGMQIIKVEIRFRFKNRPAASSSTELPDKVSIKFDPLSGKNFPFDSYWQKWGEIREGVFRPSPSALDFHIVSL